MPDDDIHPTLPDQDDWNLLTRYVAGECSPGEAAGVERRLAMDAGLRAEVDEMRRTWERAGALPSASRIDAMWHGLQARMAEPAVPASGEKASSRGRPRRLELAMTRPSPRWRAATGVAAAGIAAVAVGIALHGEREQPVPPPRPPVEREFSTARGQRATVALADGSQVELGVDSRVRVRLHENGRREVWLEGEAVFDVVHDERRPFLVYSGNAVTEDLGTRFGIRAYPGDRAVRVIVVEGKVALRPAGPRALDDTASAVLGARDLGELDAEGKARVRRGVNPEAYLAWTEGRLVFRQATLAEITSHLQRWYDVDFAIPDRTTAARRVTLNLRVASLDEVLQAVTVPLGVRYERAGRRITVRP
jgi:transmembrane sensor